MSTNEVTTILDRYTTTTTTWAIIIDHGHVGSPYRYFTRDLCTFGYPGLVCASAPTKREALEMLAIEPVSLDLTMPAGQRDLVPIGRGEG
jgi:hypothetical protein